MNWNRWLDKNDIQKVEVTQKSLDDLWKLIHRDLQDALIKELSNDRRFATAYGAALNISSYLIRRNGYRVVAKRGHHGVTFSIAEQILGTASKNYFAFFDLCRRKRNKVDYDTADITTDTEVLALIETVEEYRRQVLALYPSTDLKPQN